MASTQNQWDQKPSINKEDDDVFLHAMLLSTSQVIPMVLNAAIELNLFDIIASRANRDGYMSPSEISSQLPTKNPDGAPFLLDRMLRLLASYSLLTFSMRTCEDGRVERLYGLSPAGKFYVRNEHGAYLGSLALLNFYGKEADAWHHLKDAILEEGNLFTKVYGTSVFEYMEADPRLNNLLNTAMADLSQIVMKRVLETYKGFEGVSLLVDVAGGTGATLNKVISMYPSIKGVNFDLPQAIKHAPSYPGIKHVGGDMYVSIPKGDAIILKSTCHNWNDEQCIKLLKNCNKALRENGKVIIIDHVMPEAPESSDAAKFVSSIDNVMLVNFEGKERTEKEFEGLSKRSGFSGFRLICSVYHVWGVMELYK